MIRNDKPIFRGYFRTMVRYLEKHKIFIEKFWSLSQASIGFVLENLTRSGCFF